LHVLQKCPNLWGLMKVMGYPESWGSSSVDGDIRIDSDDDLMALQSRDGGSN
jgi:hypothetical protein